MIVIFDLDGTLVDTYPIIRKSLVELFDSELPDLDYDEEMLASFFGPTLYESFSKLTKDEKEIQFLIDGYRTINYKYYGKEITLFPKTKELLDSLIKNHKLVILSNRIQTLVEMALEVTGVKDYFDLVLGLDKLVEPKPSPAEVLQVTDYYNSKKAVFIGDAITDVIAANEAGIVSIGVTWALTTKEEFEEVNADYIVDNYEELLKVLEDIDV